MYLSCTINSSLHCVFSFEKKYIFIPINGSNKKVYSVLVIYLIMEL